MTTAACNCPDHFWPRGIRLRGSCHVLVVSPVHKFYSLVLSIKIAIQVSK